MLRTYGETKNCAGCRFWSEMIAQSIGGGPVEAMCLAEGPYSGKYTTARMACDAWKSGHYGPVDDYPDYGKEARALYAEEEIVPAEKKPRKR